MGGPSFFRKTYLLKEEEKRTNIDKLKNEQPVYFATFCITKAITAKHCLSNIQSVKAVHSSKDKKRQSGNST